MRHVLARRQTPCITRVPAHKQSNYSVESRREAARRGKQAHDERVPLNWWVGNGKVFMLNAATPRGLGSAAVPSPCPRAPLIIPFKWNVNPRFPQFLPCQYVFDSRSAPPTLRSASPLPPGLPLFLLTLSIPPLPPSALSSYLPLFSHFSLFLVCQKVRLRLQPSEAGEFYHTGLNKSIWFHKYICGCCFFEWIWTGFRLLQPNLIAIAKNALWGLHMLMWVKCVHHQEIEETQHYSRN